MYETFLPGPVEFVLFLIDDAAGKSVARSSEGSVSLTMLTESLGIAPSRMYEHIFLSRECKYGDKRVCCKQNIQSYTVHYCIFLENQGSPMFNKFVLGSRLLAKRAFSNYTGRQEIPYK